MEIEQSEAKLIIYRLDRVDGTLQTIISKLDEMNAINGKQDILIAEHGKDINNIGEKISSHKQSHNHWIGWLIMIAGIISAGVSMIIAKIIK